MMKKLVALLMALAMLCSSIAAFAEPVPNDNPSAEPGRVGEDAYGYISVTDADEYKNHVGHNVQKSGTAGPEADVAPTCTTAGKTWSVCKNDDCKVRFWQPENALDHDFSVLVEELKAPSYTEEGLATYKCSRCDETKDLPVDKLTTAYGPTEEYTEYIETPGDGHHKHGWYSIKLSTNPTCTEDGFYKILCADCGEIYQYTNEEKEALGHDVANPGSEVTKERTCTEDGVITYKGHCARCDKDVTWDEVWKAPGHDFKGVVGIEIKKATCTENQVQRFICKVCQFPDDREVPDTKLGHTWEDENWSEPADHDHVIEQPTCAKDGSIGEAEVCDRCGAPNPDTLETVQKIDAINHTDEWLKCIRGLDEDGNYTGTYMPDVKKLMKDLYDELVALGVELKPFEATTIQEVIKAIEDQDIPADVLIKVLDNVTVDMYPTVTYTYPTVDEETGAATTTVLDLSKVTSVPKYLIPIAVKITTDLGDAEQGIDPTVVTVNTTGLVHETKVVYNAPTCTATGSIVLTCTECDAEPYVIELPKLEHIYVPIRGVKNINDLELSLIKDCTKANSILQKCILCGHRYNQAIEPAKKHTIDFEYDADEEELCGDSMIVGFVQQKEWDDEPVTYYLNGTSLDDIDITMGQFYGYGYDGDERLYWTKLQNAFSKIATCRDFDVIVKCAVPFCQHTEKIHIAAYTEHHASEYVIDIAPTCTEYGYQGFNCEACGEFHTEEFDPNGHTEIDGKTLVEPTCTEKGSREILCSVCKEVVGTEEIPALGHHMVPYFDPANCKIGKVGVSYQYCAKCGYIDPATYVEDDGHRYAEDDITAYTAPTCTTKGSISFVCNICHKDIVNKEIKALDHDYVEDLQKLEPATCKIGQEHGTIHHYECSRCGDTKTKDDGDIPAHRLYKIDPVTETKSLYRFNVVTLPTCEKEGKAQFVCTRCFDLVKDVVLKPLPHNYQIKFNEKTGAYELVCTKFENTELGRTNLYNKMVESGYEAMVAAAIIDQLSETEGTYIKGTGCGDVQPIEIRKTEYTITKVSETRGQIELVEGALWAKDDEYVRIVWRYTLGNGDTISFVTTREVRWTYDEETGKRIGSFKLTGLTVPEDAECNFIRVEVVTDPDADEKYAGQYDAYGYEVWKY